MILNDVLMHFALRPSRLSTVRVGPIANRHDRLPWLCHWQGARVVVEPRCDEDAQAMNMRPAP
jgi:hypothetical protein